MDKIFGIIGGSGFYKFPELLDQSRHSIETPYGIVDGIVRGHVSKEKNGSGERGKENVTVFFLPRHGGEHQLPPHKINYRANIAALSQSGVTHILAFNALGGITPECSPGSIVLVDQVIDYTYGREHSFFDALSDVIEYTNFESPSDSELHSALIDRCTIAGTPFVGQATYACTQGPRLETSAEVRRLARDGCDVVGMTMMPEAALAAEKKMAYASIGLVVNWAAGVNKEVFSLDNILALLDSSVPEIRETMLKTIRFF